MKKIAICVVLLLCLGAGSLFAQDMLSFSEPIGHLSPIINLGVGFGGTWGYGTKIPPLGGSVDIPVDVGVPLSFGLGVQYASWGVSWVSLNALYINARIAMHFNFGVQGLDIYPLMSFGALTLWWNWINDRSWSATGFGFGIAAGMRYFFNDNIGVWAEAGYSDLSYISAGVTFTFGGGGSSGSSSSRSSGNYYVNNDTLNVRSQPNADSSIVGVLKRGDRVTVLNNSGTWWEIRSGNIRGYVNSNYLARN